MNAPRSVTENGQLADVRSDLTDMVAALPNHGQTPGRKALLAMIETAQAGGASDGDTVNASFNAASNDTTGQMDLTAVVTVVRARPAMARSTGSGG